MFIHEIDKSKLIAARNKLLYNNKHTPLIQFGQQFTNQFIDIKQLSILKDGLENYLIKQLLSSEKEQIEIAIDFERHRAIQHIDQEMDDIKKIKQQLNRLHRLSLENKNGKSSHPLYLAYPFLQFTNKENEAIKSPLLFFEFELKINAKQVNAWIISINTQVNINEALVSYISQQHQLQLSIEELSNFDIKDVLKTVLSNLNFNKVPFTENYILDTLNKPIQFFDPNSSKNEIDLIPSGMLGVFKGPNQFSIDDINYYIDQYDHLKAKNNLTHGSLNIYPSHILDPSQYDILEMQNNPTNDKILIQGPPGTGKSTVIKDVIIQNLLHKKTTVVVSDKSNALNVIEQQLKEAGYDDLIAKINNHGTDRNKVVKKARLKFDQIAQKSHPGVNDSIFNQYNIDREILKKQYKHQNRKFNKEGNIIDLIDQFLRIQSRLKNIAIPNINFELNQDNFELIYRIIEECIEIYPKSDPSIYYDMQLIFFEDLIIKNNYDKLYPLIASLKSDIALCQAKVESIIEKYIIIKKNDITTEKQNISKLLEGAKQLVDLEKANKSSKYNSLKSDGRLKKLFANKFELEKKNKFKIKIDRLLQKGKHLLEKETKEPKSILEAIKVIDELERKWNEHFIEELQKASDFIYNLDLSKSHFYHIQEEINSAINPTTSLLNSIFKDVKLDRSTANKLNLSLKDYIYKTDATSFTEQEIKASISWMNFYTQIPDSIQVLIKKLLENRSDLALEKFKFIYLSQSIKAQFNGDEIKNDLSLKRTKEVIDSLQININRKVNNYYNDLLKLSLKNYNNKHNDNVKHLYNIRSNSNNSQNHLRMIIKKEKELFKSSFPVVLISSSELANLFPHFYQYFDTLIIDESTRSSFENNISNFLKSKQIIISGDEQQMPPKTLYKNDQTDIFSSQSQTYDSVFQFAEEHQFKAINLNYHYRSKHRDLFRFSNKAFYHNLINLLPNRKTEAISFFQVDGMFHEHLNKRETEKIIDWLINLEYSKQSIGIYTLNLKQKEFIESAISEKVDKNEVFRNKYFNWIKNGFSVMNLENIQGEEKDIVILSLCYGNTIKHQFTANFGFLSSYQGYKYLNVLITRAKEQLVIFNSIRANFYQKWPKETNYNHKMFFAFIDYAQACSSKDENKVQNILDHVNTIDQSKPAIRFEQKHNYISERIKQVLINDFNISSNIKINSYLGDFAIDILVPELKLIILNDLDKNPINNFITDLYKKEQLASFGYHVIYTWSPMWFQNEQFAIEQLKEKLAEFIKS